MEYIDQAEQAKLLFSAVGGMACIFLACLWGSIVNKINAKIQSIWGRK